MSSVETYLLDTDFSNGLDLNLLGVEITLQLPSFIYTSIHGNTVDLIFNTTLNVSEKTTLDTIITNHLPTVGLNDIEQLSSCQVRRSTILTSMTTYTPVTFTLADLENNTDILYYTGSDAIKILETGTYKVEYNMNIENDMVEARVRVNDTTTIPGSSKKAIPGTGGIHILHCASYVNLVANDDVKLEIQTTGVANVLEDMIFSVIRYKAIKGENGATGIDGATGPQGPAGPSGDGTGNVVQALGISVDSSIPVYDGITGTLLKNSNVIIDNSDNVTIPTTSTLNIGSLIQEFSSEGNSGHLRFSIKDNYNSDPYDFGIDNSKTERVIIESLSGQERQAIMLLGDSLGSQGTIFGISTSSDNGTVWNPQLIVKHNGFIGIGTNNPLNTLDINGSIGVTGTVAGRDIASDGVILDNLNILNQYNSINDPVVSNDTSQGYVIGSKWRNTSTEVMWVCINNTLGSAIWEPISYKDTDQIIEATNLYYTDARVNTYINTLKDQPNGLASLNISGKIPSSQLDLNSRNYLGTWNASTNTPTITTGTNGDYYIITVSGTTSIDGTNSWSIGDEISYNGTIWEKIPNQGVIVSSVASKTGDITLVSSDITDLNTDTVVEGTNKYYTDALVDSRISLQKANPNGLASLNGSGQVPTGQINFDGYLTSKGSWNASTNNPTLVSSVGTNGEFYIVSVAGSTILDSVTNWNVGDWALFDSIKWIKINHSSLILSVNGYTGTVTLNKTDIGLNLVENTKVNLLAVSQPGITDDVTANYTVGSRWIDNVTMKEYVCVDNTIGNAIWRETTVNIDTEFIFIDDFFGSDLNLHWSQETQGTTSRCTLIDAIGGQVELRSHNATSDFSELCFNKKNIIKSTKAIIKFRLKMDSITQSLVELGVKDDVNNLTRFIYNASGSGVNWFCETILGGTSTSNDSTVSGDTSWHIFEIIFTDTVISFSIDGNIISTNTTNLPSTIMAIYVRQTSNSTVTKVSLLDFIKVKGERE